MKKALLTVAAALLLISLLSVSARAAEIDGEAWYGGLWESVDADTKELLEQVGMDGVSPEGFLSLSPFRVFSLIGKIAAGEAVSPLRYGAGAVLAAVLTALAGSLLPPGGAMRDRCETLGRLCVMFVLLSGTGQALRECMPAVTATKDFMLALVPVFTGVMGFAGNPALALSWGGAVLGFSETVGVFFAKYVPSAASLGTAAVAAANLNEETDFSAAAKTACKAVTVAMGLAAGLFSAVLSVRDVIAAASDTVSMKGAKLVVGQGVPIVGGAVSEVLNTVAAGLGLIRDTVGMFAVLALFLLVLVPLVRLLLWKGVFRFFSACASLLGQGRVASLADGLNSLLSVILAVICFNSAVFIIAVALVTRLAGGG